ncbi:MAG TPA: 23S rRNA (guanosine(2251)-2'-O)-methyltransferase RlmB [Anaerolineae bacterium]|nr:23S rRNA (guanosine(2251)-2'-O)-methyltransferase RlmB [Anaerolineae bacterium]HID84549.1 23S rRNA (guanosine(2251)-2'-O)-methyltransferase RlmB [Anaerolineales bacterium]HIQ08877.1 23S rRNA (guanosine(2251)-2'-O)-methyltransferase RlmB [Anaerolineaceae bacterium]
MPREWLYGRNPVYEALRAGRRHFFRLRVAEGVRFKGRLGDVLRLAEAYGVPVEQVPRKMLDAVVPANHQGVALEASGYPYADLEQMWQRAEKGPAPPLFLLLDTLQDPQNLASLLRTAEAVGVHGVLLPRRRTVTVTPAVVRASSGASEHLLIGQMNLAQGIRALQERGVWVVGLEGGPEAEPLERVRLDAPLALVVGSEGEGLRRLTRETCDVLLRLPMQGRVASLNAAVAGSVALYFVWQARGFTGGNPASGIDERGEV